MSAPGPDPDGANHDHVAGVTISDIDIPWPARDVLRQGGFGGHPATIIVWFIMAFLAMIFSAVFGFGFGGGRGWMTMMR